MARPSRKSEVTRFKRVEPTAPATSTKSARTRRATKDGAASAGKSAPAAHPHIKAQIFGSVLILVACPSGQPPRESAARLRPQGR